MYISKVSTIVLWSRPPEILRAETYSRPKSKKSVNYIRPPTILFADYGTTAPPTQQSLIKPYFFLNTLTNPLDWPNRTLPPALDIFLTLFVFLTYLHTIRCWLLVYTHTTPRTSCLSTYKVLLSSIRALYRPNFDRYGSHVPGFEERKN